MSSRKKSCLACRKSKARCSLDSPCWRCLGRKIECVYDLGHVPQRHTAAARRRTLIPSSSATLNELPVPRPDPSPSGQSWENLGLGTDMAVDLDDYTDHEPSYLDDLPLPSIPESSNGYKLGFAFNFNTLDTSSAAPISEDESTSFSWLLDPPFGQQDLAMDLTSTQLSSGAPLDVQAVSTSGLPVERVAESTPVLRYYSKQPLSPRKSSRPEKQLHMRVLLGQILAYPAMMIRGGRLPPFIFPKCAMDGPEAAHACTSKGYHKCLPKTLAICSSLVQSWENRTEGSSAFVWDSIYAEVAKLRRESTAYSKEELVECLQALVIYLLLQARDLESIDLGRIDLLLSAPVFIGKRLWLDESFSWMPVSDTRQEWTLIECIRRTSCLLFGIELLLDVNLTPCCELPGLQGYATVPLPSTRDLWEPISNTEWVARYEELDGPRRDSHVHKLPSIRDLQAAKQASQPSDVSVAAPGTSDRNEEVGRWCERLDDFGMLVWMAVMLEG